MKTQMFIETDLFKFAYLGEWQLHLQALAALAYPEPWRFKQPSFPTRNQDTPILERYMNHVFRKLAKDYNYAADRYHEDMCLYMDAEVACFHTGLYTAQGESIYALFEENIRRNTLVRWCFAAFVCDTEPRLAAIEPLPQPPAFYMADYAQAFYLDWPIYPQTEKIRANSYDISNIPMALRTSEDLDRQLRETLRQSCHRAEVIPDYAVQQVLTGRVQYLLPMHMTGGEAPDFAISLSVMEGFYLAHSCLPLEMAYHHARLWAPVTAPWLLDLVEPIEVDLPETDMRWMA